MLLAAPIRGIVTLYRGCADRPLLTLSLSLAWTGGLVAFALFGPQLGG